VVGLVRDGYVVVDAGDRELPDSGGQENGADGAGEHREESTCVVRMRAGAYCESAVLNKVVCKRCVCEEHLELDVSTMCESKVRVVSTDNREWTEKDEEHWLAGFVFCNADIASPPERADVGELPPRWCPYACEHVVSRG
jgi:hypothetical protein